MKLPICCKCQTEMHCLKNGVFIKYLYNNEIFNADAFQCDYCNHTVISGIALEPYPYIVPDKDIYLKVKG